MIGLMVSRQHTEGLRSSIIAFDLQSGIMAVKTQRHAHAPTSATMRGRPPGHRHLRKLSEMELAITFSFLDIIFFVSTFKPWFRAFYRSRGHERLIFISDDYN